MRHIHGDSGDWSALPKLPSMSISEKFHDSNEFSKVCSQCILASLDDAYEILKFIIGVNILD